MLGALPADGAEDEAAQAAAPAGAEHEQVGVAAAGDQRLGGDAEDGFGSHGDALALVTELGDGGLERLGGAPLGGGGPFVEMRSGKV
jgi:hypothetical protein